MQLSIKDILARFPNASIYLKVHPNNTRGISLYTSENFVESSRVATPHGPRIVMDMVMPTKKAV